MQPDPLYDESFDFDRLDGEYDFDGFDGETMDGDVASIIAAFDPHFEPDLLIEYLRVWAASSRTHASDLFDHVVSIEMESVASLEVQRLIETRVERVIQVPGNAVLPHRTYAGPIARSDVASTEHLVEEVIEARRVGSEHPVACRCRNGAAACHACHGSGATSAGACVACGTTGSVAHETCGGAGQLIEYTHGTITRSLETTWTMSRNSRGISRAGASDWWQTEVDPGGVLAMLPHESVARLNIAWNQDPPNTSARHGTLSALPIYHVVFRRRGRDCHAWLMGSNLRVVVPGAVGRTPDWLIKRSIKVGATVMSLMSAWVWWQGHTTPQATPTNPAGQSVVSAPATPSAPKTVSVPKPLPGHKS
jgi:hypothetical protein